ncbi:unnamed protein product [Zymoseptoria tritici ST99CH_3D1]|nr:unnamed protein product [Zymoseptoria tritici ST99CH_3D1]
MPTTTNSTLQSQIWSGSLALEIHLAPSDCRTYDQSEPYLIHFPRLSYLAFLLPRLHAFFTPALINPEVSSHDAWFTFEDVPLKWHYPLGLLYDLYSGAEPVDLASAAETDDAASSKTSLPTPWKLTIHYSDYPEHQLLHLDPEGRTMHDTFINSVKEADFVRNGSARAVMGLSKEDSDNLWLAVRTHDLPLFTRTQHKLLHPPGLSLRHIPLKLYLPTSSSSLLPADPIPEDPSTTPSSSAHLRVVQSLIPLHIPGTKSPQTLGTALNKILPTIFPSRRSPIYARVVLHGVALPLGVELQGLMLNGGGFGDGWLHLGVVMHG